MDLAAFDKAKVNTYLGEYTLFQGKVTAQVPIRIDGPFEGEIQSESDVFIGPKSKTKADIKGKRVIVAGTVTGNIYVTESLEICRHGKVYGNIGGTTLIIHEGALYKGQVNTNTIATQNDYEGPIEIPGH